MLRAHLLEQRGAAATACARAKQHTACGQWGAVNVPQSDVTTTATSHSNLAAQPHCARLLASIEPRAYTACLTPAGRPHSGHDACLPI